MALETGDYINNLNPLYPLVDDEIREGDDHIRLLKNTIKNTFPSADKEITPTSEQFNKIIVSEKNYDNVENVRDEDLREPNDLDEAITWQDNNLRSRVTGNTFEDETYDPEEDVPTPRPDNYPNELNIYEFEQRLAEVEGKIQIPVNGYYLSVSDDDPNTVLGYGTWFRELGGHLLAGSGTGVDQNGNIYTIPRLLSPNNTGQAYSVILKEEELPKHDHGYQRFQNNLYGTPEEGHNGYVYVRDRNIVDTTSVGGGEKHNNQIPAAALYLFRRTN